MSNVHCGGPFQSPQLLSEMVCCSMSQTISPRTPSSSNKQQICCDVCLEVEVRGKIIENCSVLYCVLKMCTVISTLRGAVLTVFWIGFCLNEPISLCIDSFVFISVYFVLFCYGTGYVLYYCNRVDLMGLKPKP